MSTRTTHRVKIYTMWERGYTCGVCHREVMPGEQYAGVLFEGAMANPDGLRGTRHIGECADWTAQSVADLRVGDVVYSHRYTVHSHGGRIRGVVVNICTTDVNEIGWYAVWLAPNDPTDTSPLDGFRTIAERDGAEWAAKVVRDNPTVDPLPQRIYMSPRELIHFKR